MHFNKTNEQTNLHCPNSSYPRGREAKEKELVTKILLLNQIIEYRLRYFHNETLGLENKM